MKVFKGEKESMLSCLANGKGIATAGDYLPNHIFPTIQDIGHRLENTDHMGFGLFRGYHNTKDVFFNGGGAMYRAMNPEPYPPNQMFAWSPVWGDWLSEDSDQYLITLGINPTLQAEWIEENLEAV